MFTSMQIEQFIAAGTLRSEIPALKSRFWIVSSGYVSSVLAEEEFRTLFKTFARYKVTPQNL